MAFGQRKFKIRVQKRDASSSKPARIGLVAQRSIVVKGVAIKAGQAVDLTQKRRPLQNILQKPKKFVNPAGARLAAKQVTLSKNNKKVGKFYGTPRR